MLARSLLVGGLLVGGISATPIAGGAAVEVAHNVRAVNVADAIPVRRDLDYNEVVDTVAGWGKDYVHTNYPHVSRDLETRDMSSIIDTIIGWIKEWLSGSSSSSSSSGSNGTSGGLGSPQPRDLDYNQMADQVGEWAKDYFQPNVQERGVQARDVSSIIDTIIGWIKQWWSSRSSSSSSSSGSGSVPASSSPQARDLDYNEVADTVGEWAKDYFQPNVQQRGIQARDASSIIDTLIGWFKQWMSGSSSSSSTSGSPQARSVDTNDVVDHLAQWTKDYFNGDKTVTTRDGTTFDSSVDKIAEKVKTWINASPNKLAARDMSFLGTIIDDLVQWTQDLFGTNDWGQILKTVIDWLAEIL